MCLLPTHGLPHVALRYEGRKSARSPGHQDRRNLSPRLSVSYAIASERFARPACTPELLVIAVDPSAASPSASNLKDEARASLKSRSEGGDEEEIGVDINGGGGSKMLEQ